MNKLAFILTLAATPLVASAALASPSCGNAAQSTWMSLADVEAKATAMGYKVRQVKIEDGCYEVYALDRNGNRIEAYLNPVTAEIVKTKIDD
jgi:hypothetical protein